MLKKRMLVVMVVLGLLAVWAVPALAVPPDRWKAEIQFPPDDPQLVLECEDEGFQILTYGTWYIDGTTYFDKDGIPIREKWEVTFDDTFYNSVTGKDLMSSSGVNAFVDLQSGEITSAGIGVKIHVPGAGVLLMDAGLYKFDADGNLVFAVGNNEYYFPEEGDLDKICAWFAE